VAQRCREYLTVCTTSDTVVAAAIVQRGRLLVQQRAWPAAHAGRWELPGGRVDDGESERDALIRECAEELGVVVHLGVRVGHDIPLPGSDATLRVYAATLADQTAKPRAVEHRAIRWVHVHELDTVDWLPADRALLPALRELLRAARR
jgi:8-oxo-dGTP diphosphatase